MFAMRSTLLLR